MNLVKRGRRGVKGEVKRRMEEGKKEKTGSGSDEVFVKTVYVLLNRGGAGLLEYSSRGPDSVCRFGYNERVEPLAV